MTVEVLNNDEHRPIIRIGDTVRRPTSWWTPAVHDALRYLESVAFPFSPRVLGVDDEGREVLSFIDGESGKQGWSKIHSDRGLRNFARLLRTYHEAIADYHPATDSVWACATGGKDAGQILCHGDFGPWNIVWRGDEPVGIVDWDLLFPAASRFDVLYALEYAAPFRNDQTTLTWHHFAEVPNRRRRIQLFADAYGLDDWGDIIADVAAMQRTVAEHVKYLAGRGVQPQANWVASGALETIEERARWTEHNRALFE